MDSNEFVEAIRMAVERPSLDGIEQLLTKPPGRSPNKELLKRSHWYNKLTDEDKRMVLEIAKESIQMSLFNFFCVLDGVSAIEDTEKKGVLELYFEKDGERIFINDPNREFLHDIYNSE
jgi:hypothetical protein